MKLNDLRVTAFFFVLLCVLALSSPALGQDPVKVAGDMYKLVFENDQVRILEAKLAPGTKTAMHSHSDMVAVILEPGTAKWTMADGKTESSPPDLKRGMVVDRKSETHITENVGQTPLHVMLVEFKKSAPAAGQGRNPSLPAPYKQVADTRHARVFELMTAPGEQVSQHTHGDHVTISLTDATGEVTDTDGKKQTLSFKKDTAMFNGPATHSGVNAGTTALHIIDIELK